MRQGFTLAELLIALAILAIIATFVIPKVLTNQVNQRFDAQAKEVAGMLSQAYLLYKASNTVTTTTGVDNLTPYMNYVRIDSTGVDIDHIPGFTTANCNATAPCIRLANGGALLYYADNTWSDLGGTSATNAMLIYFDPDGTYCGSTSCNSKAIRFWLYTDGKIRTDADMIANTFTGAGGPENPNTSFLPNWFSW